MHRFAAMLAFVSIMLMVKAEAHPFKVDLGEVYYDWMMMGATQTGTSALAGDVGYLTPHLEESSVTEKYTEICIQTAGAGAAGSIAQLALYDYDSVTLLPEDLLWYSAQFSITSAGVYCVDFGAVTATITSAGAGYFDANSDLELDPGEAIWRGFGRSVGTPTTHNLNVASRRNLGLQSVLGNATFSGVTYASWTGWSALTTIDASVTPSTGAMPVIALHRL